MHVLEAVDVHRIYPVEPPVHALKGVNFTVDAGETAMILGKSGSGKSTFLNQVGLLDRPTFGEIRIQGQSTSDLANKQLDRLRAEMLGFVFQENHILGHRTVEENLAIKLALTSIPRSVWGKMIISVLAQVGLEHRSGALGRLLSGGEKQRLAVARAIISSPKLLLADEPTGNLDEENAENVMELFEQQAAGGTAVVIITHDKRLTSLADNSYYLDQGQLIGWSHSSRFEREKNNA